MKLNNTSTLVSLLCGSLMTLCATSAQAASFTGFNFKPTLEPGPLNPKGDIFLKSAPDFFGKVVSDFNLVTSAKIIENNLTGKLNTQGPASSDRGDNASGIKADFPDEDDIVKSLGNLNLNNIIDTEDNKATSILNVFFKTAADTFFFFERGLNSDLTVQAIGEDGGLIGDAFEITSSLFKNAGYRIDTTEIEGAQTVGSFGLKFDSKIAGLQLSSKVGDNGPDFKVVAAQTASVPEPATLAGLGLVAGSLLASRRRQANKVA